MTDEQRIEKLRSVVEIVVFGFRFMHDVYKLNNLCPDYTEEERTIMSIDLELSKKKPDLKKIDDLIDSLGGDIDPGLKEISDKIENELKKDS